MHGITKAPNLAVILFTIGLVGLTPLGVRAAEQTFALKIEHGHVPANMRLIRVMQGDTVKLEVTSDQRQFVHLHGYEIMKEVTLGAVTELAFTANLTGRFPVHLHGGHEDASDHGHEDTLVNIEVYPR
jgi:hypothetical protein